MSSSVDKKTVKAGEPVNVRIVVSGVGNMKLLKQPDLSLPKDFEKYDPKITDKTKLTAEGVTGSMIYDILVVPRNKGAYTIPPVNFIYFDTQTHQYKTIFTQPIQIEVEKGSGNGSVSDYTHLNDNDIHDIVSGELTQFRYDEIFFGTKTYYGIVLTIVLTFITLCIIFRKRAIAASDVTSMRGKKADKVAVKRLRKALRFMKQNKRDEFYDEVLRALWNYVSDKFSMPAEQLSRDYISEQLSMRNVEPHVIDSFIEAINECEYARYAPGDVMGNMQTTLDKATTAIVNIENR